MSSVSVSSSDMQEIFSLTTPFCSQDKDMEGNGLLFPELGNTISTSQVSLLKEPLQKPTTVISLNMEDSDANEDALVSYLESMTGSTGSVSPQHSDLEYMENVFAQPNSQPRIKIKSVSHDEDRYMDDDEYSVDFKKPLGSLSGSLSMSKNAIAARENRQKKKSYVTNLESSVKSLSHENSSLKKNVNSLENSVDSLKNEVEYLKSVLANQGTLGSLLKNIASTQGVKFRSSEFQAVARSTEPQVSKNSIKRKKNNSKEDNNSDSQKENDSIVNGVTTRIGTSRKIQKLDHDYAAAGSKKATSNGYDAESDTDSDAEEESGAGVCLHVSNKKVSLEFCANCSKKAEQSTSSRRKKVHVVSRR